MLVFTRAKDQQIVIDDNIVVTVVAVRGDRIRLGIEAPKHVPVYRSELPLATRRATEQTEPRTP
jgi:carbon storage regulator